MQGPVILCGLGMVGWRVLEFLRTAGLPVVAIDNIADPADHRLAGIHFVKGDFRNQKVLVDAGIRSAGGVLVVTSDDLINLSACMLIRSLNPDVRIVLRMFNQNLISRLSKTVPNISALSVSALAVPMLALAGLTGDVLAAFSVGNGSRQIGRIQISEGSRFIGRRIADFDDNLGRFRVLSHTTPTHPRKLLDLDLEARIGAGDKIIVSGQPDDIARLLNPDQEQSLDVLWASRIRRYRRIVGRTLAQMDMAVKICTSVLIMVVFFSTLVYHFGLGHPWADALYHTISVIATGADMAGKDYDAPGKVFVSFLRIAGTSLIAAFTAIVTNFLLRSNLGLALEIRRIPEGGHVVVCGVGNVGYRVVGELLRLGEQVVVVEQRGDTAFVAACRRQGVAIVVGDATMEEVLNVARVKSARAVIVATSKDLVNLEVALLLTDRQPKQRVVVRLGDSVLAETIRQAAHVKLALSIPELTAPAFLARLLGDRVLAIFLIDGQILGVLELAVTADDSRLVKQSLRALAVDYGFVPIAVVGTDDEARNLPTSYCLQAGDRLTVVATMADLERLIRREPVSAGCTVWVTACPAGAREVLEGRVCDMRKLSVEDAAKYMENMPFILAEKQTKGEAEEWVATLHGEHIGARMEGGE